MEETANAVEAFDANAQLSDKAVVAVVGTLVAVAAKHFAEKGVKLGLVAYRARKAAA